MDRQGEFSDKEGIQQLFKAVRRPFNHLEPAMGHPYKLSMYCLGVFPYFSTKHLEK